MKMYNLSGGSNPRRVRMYLAEKGIEVPMVEVDSAANEHQSDQFLAKNPLGKLPVLELDDGTYLAESMAIIRYFEVLHPEPPLLGRSALEQATIEMWNRRMEFELNFPIANTFQHTHRYWADRLEQVPDYGEVCRRKALATVEWLDRELAQREFIAGDQYTVADITAQAGLILGKVIKFRLPAELEHITRWWGRVSERPSAKA